MAKGDQINLKPHFKNEGPTLPCEGEVGDIYVFTPFDEGEADSTQDGRASLWFCTKRAEGDGRNAIWKRVQFDGFSNCDVPPPNPPPVPPVRREN